MKKQMCYADSKHITFVAIVGETELAEGKIMLKNMVDGTQEKLTIDDVINRLK